ncbi:hypothetical protein BDZ90DRAFT_36452 [Jaminaea rosea]|uniref:Secreted protein n=1 Tax=Jaminaea rosea TaxID=1569628 RepID=A0A316V0Q3_9BASI|nr:hypothetical protein BDZ90DRAFT_36452 [Jaminaea rosea]PWN31129.1 hypothetical protein BDZ90DRAFT_36452 [Jaminaea rosea]
MGVRCVHRLVPLALSLLFDSFRARRLNTQARRAEWLASLIHPAVAAAAAAKQEALEGGARRAGRADQHHLEITVKQAGKRAGPSERAGERESERERERESGQCSQVVPIHQRRGLTWLPLLPSPPPFVTTSPSSHHQ